MTGIVLFLAREALWPQYRPVLERLFAEKGLDLRLVRETDDPASVDFLVYAPGERDDDLSPYTNVRLIQSLWAGPDRLLKNPTLTQPLARMVDPGMTRGMVDYVMGHVLYHHLHTPDFAAAAPGEWRPERAPPLSFDRTVGFLGLGELGAACARAAHDFGFRVVGWARSPKAGLPFETHHGAEGLAETLSRSEILVTLLPSTPETRGLIDAQALAWLPRGAALINPGRGELIDDAALIAALRTGHVRSASLDVFVEEPLPADRPYWHLPQVLVTPHVASETRVETASEVVAENFARVLRGEPPLHLVDRARGY